MENLKFDMNLKGETVDMNEAPALDYKKLYYNCSECSSLIEIISIDEENIEFKCNNKHIIKMKIKDYLIKMKKYNNYKLNNQICDKHKKEYSVYCLECNVHLCNDCLKLGEHKFHFKINLIEILPNNESLIKIHDLIKDNQRKMDDLIKTQLKMENTIKNILNKNKEKFIEIKKRKKKNYDIEKKKELEIIQIKHKYEIKKLKEEYENRLKEVKLKYYKAINNVNIKYKLMENMNEKIFNNKINESSNKVKSKVNKEKLQQKVEKISNFNELIEIVYNTYINYNNNYFNTININNIYEKFFNKNVQITEIEEKYKTIKDIIQNYDSKNKNKEKLLVEKDYIIKEQENIINYYKMKINDKDNIINKYESRIKENINKQKEEIIEQNINIKDNPLQNNEIKIDEKNNIFQNQNNDNKKPNEEIEIKHDNKINKIQNCLYNFECLNQLELQQYIYENVDFIEIPLTLKNTGSLAWPLNNTKLIFDSKFEIKGKDIELKSLQVEEEETFIIKICNLGNLKSGRYETGVWFNINGVNYGNMINFEINVEKKEDDNMKKNIKKIEEYRNIFSINKNDYSDKYLFNRLSRNNYNFEATFLQMFD